MKMKNFGLGNAQIRLFSIMILIEKYALKRTNPHFVILHQNQRKLQTLKSFLKSNRRIIFSL